MLRTTVPRASAQWMAAIAVHTAQYNRKAPEERLPVITSCMEALHKERQGWLSTCPGSDPCTYPTYDVEETLRWAALATTTTAVSKSNVAAFYLDLMKQYASRDDTFGVAVQCLAELRIHNIAPQASHYRCLLNGAVKRDPNILWAILADVHANKVLSTRAVEVNHEQHELTLDCARIYYKHGKWESALSMLKPKQFENFMYNITESQKHRGSWMAAMTLCSNVLTHIVGAHVPTQSLQAMSIFRGCATVLRRKNSSKRHADRYDSLIHALRICCVHNSKSTTGVSTAEGIVQIAESLATRRINHAVVQQNNKNYNALDASISTLISRCPIGSWCDAMAMAVALTQGYVGARSVQPVQMSDIAQHTGVVVGELLTILLAAKKGELATELMEVMDSHRNRLDPNAAGSMVQSFAAEGNYDLAAKFYKQYAKSPQGKKSGNFHRTALAALSQEAFGIMQGGALPSDQLRENSSRVLQEAAGARRRIQTDPEVSTDAKKLADFHLASIVGTAEDLGFCTKQTEERAGYLSRTTFAAVAEMARRACKGETSAREELRRVATTRSGWYCSTLAECQRIGDHLKVVEICHVLGKEALLLSLTGEVEHLLTSQLQSMLKRLDDVSFNALLAKYLTVGNLTIGDVPMVEEIKKSGAAKTVLPNTSTLLPPTLGGVSMVHADGSYGLTGNWAQALQGLSMLVQNAPRQHPLLGSDHLVGRSKESAKAAVVEFMMAHTSCVEQFLELFLLMGEKE